jgi:hypothetical protein
MMYSAYWTFSQVIEAQQMAEIEEAGHAVEPRWDETTNLK